MNGIEKLENCRIKCKNGNLFKYWTADLCNCVNKSTLLSQTGELHGLNCSSGATEICASERRRVSQVDIELGPQEKATS